MKNTSERSGNSPLPFSGCKRNRADDLPQSPVFGDLDSPTPRQHSGSIFRKYLQGSFACTSAKQQDEVSQPATKMIKKEAYASPRVSIPCKLELQSSESDSESESNHSPSSDGSAASQGGTSHGKCQQGGKSGGQVYGNRMQVINRNVPRQFIFEPTDPPLMRPFCYNCKRFFHVKQQCRSPWYHWWPSEYLYRHPWLRRRVREANQLRLRGRMGEYRRVVRQLEDEVEEADKKKQQLFSQHRATNNWYGGRYFQSRPVQGRADGQKILHALRRTSKPPSPNSGCPKHHQFSFDCHRLIEQLQKQVNELRFALTDVKTASPKRINSN